MVGSGGGGHMPPRPPLGPALNLHCGLLNERAMRVRKIL